MATNNVGPLPASSSRLRDGRYQVDIARPSDRREGSWIVHTTGRFDLHNLPAALLWAQKSTPDGHHFTVTAYRAKDGFQAHAVTLPQ